MLVETPVGDPTLGTLSSCLTVNGLTMHALLFAPQGIPKKAKRLPAGPDAKLPQPDPTLLCCAFQRQRLYLFTSVGG